MVNTALTKPTSQIKTKVKSSRKKAELYQHEVENCKNDLDNTSCYEKKQTKIVEQFNALEIKTVKLNT